MAHIQPNSNSHFRTSYGFIRWQTNAKHPAAVKSLLSRNHLGFECSTIRRISVFSGEIRNKNYFYFHIRKLSHYMFYSGAIKTLACGVTGHPSSYV